MNSKAFYKSKAFYGCISTIVLIVGDMVANGVSIGNLSALAAAAFALYGRIVATAPLGMADKALDQSSVDVAQAKVDAGKKDQTWDPRRSS